MKYAFQFLGILFTACLLNACSSVFKDKNCIEGSGDVITEERPFEGSIQKIYNGIAGNVFITQGSEQKVTIQAQANLIPLLNLTLVDQELRIEFKDNSCVNNSTINIFVTAATINKVTLAGSGNIEGQNTWESPNLEAIISGSGSIKATIKSTEVNSSLGGSGNIVLSGSTQKQSLHLTGSGNYQNFGLASEQTTVNLTGSGNVEIQASQALNVTISGSGNVAYKGSPSITQNITGSGKVNNAN
ncbi:hypothetical protein BKI52_35805 [marine bacterium AO1-C]|nr:hypothetical protein BKI52_35805 [marine bacterium AO1-C]